MADGVLRVATCQFPVSGDVAANAGWVRRFLYEAAAGAADVVHFCEAALSGYGGKDVRSFAQADYDWPALRAHTGQIMDLAGRLGLWVVLGSAHFIAPGVRPTNCLYVISSEGRLADRYDKSMCTGGAGTADMAHYTSGNHLVTLTLKGVVCGLLVCYDGCFPEMYNACRHRGVTLMLHSFYNARYTEENCLSEMVPAQLRTRAADNGMWIVANNSSAYHQSWPTCVARPDGTLADSLVQHVPGILFHDFPDEKLRGWRHNYKLMKLPRTEILHNGAPVRHKRYVDRQSMP